jgi:hypothetical protein
MRSIHYEYHALSDLVPPMLSGQRAAMGATVDWRQAPVVMAMWAGVSDVVDKRLSQNLSIPVKLRPAEWRSGEATRTKRAKIVETTRTRHWVGRSTYLLAELFVSSLLVFCVIHHASSQAYTIDKTGFEASTKEFPGCKLNVSSSFSQKAINISKRELEADVVQLDEKLYCIHLYDTRTSQTQSLIISGYDFFAIYMPDILFNGQFVPRIQFRTWFFFFITVAIRDGKLVLIR